MKRRICALNSQAPLKLPEHTGDKSGVGVHYVDAHIKPMNLTLEDGTVVSCKRKGLKITLTCGPRKGEGLLRRLQLGPDPVVLLQAAMVEAASQAGLKYTVEEESIYLEEV